MFAGFNGHLVGEAFLEQELKKLTVRRAMLPTPLLERWLRATQTLGPASSIRAVLEVAAEPLARLLGYREAHDVRVGDEAASAGFPAPGGLVTWLVCGWGEPLDAFWRRAVIDARSRSTDWCVLFNGKQARLIDVRRLHARRHVEFDLDLAAGDADSIAAFALLFQAAGLSGLSDLVARSEQHASGVCRELRTGVLSASAEVLGALIARPPRPPASEAFEQALTIVYRVLFLLFAEARGLVPIWHPVYRESYSMQGLYAEIASQPQLKGLWDALRATSRLAHAGCRAGDLGVTAFNGRLFAPARTPLAERRDLDDAAAGRAVVALSTRLAPDAAGREPISYRDLGVEQLGSVYETLLDYEPRVSGTGARRVHVSLERGSGARKATGTFYTPQPIARYLVRRTLTPLVMDASPDAILALRVVDPAMGSGAILVAACHFLADAYQTALVESGGCHPSDFGPAEQTAIRRIVAERCLYGVDVNPMAVQLARLSLWLTTLAADRPLSFLDHRLQTGDSLLGAWVSSLRQPPFRRRRARPAELPLFGEAEIGEVVQQTLPVRLALATANDTVDQVHEKERALAALGRETAPVSRWKRLADLWCAHWLAAAPPPSSAFRALCDSVLTGRGALPAHVAARHLADAAEMSRSRRLFHWELEFPEVFFHASGGRRPDAGFDAVVGNPPWDMIRADGGGRSERPGTRREARSVLAFTREAGVYRSQSDGHANRYQLFVERAAALTRPGGRLGLVLPSGFALDHGSAGLRRMLFSRTAVDAVVGFDNRRAVFPIHRSVRFLLVTATAGEPTREISCRLGEQDPAVLDAHADDPAGASAWFPLRLTPALLHRLTGDDVAIPELRTPVDVAIAERAATLFPPLGEQPGWGARFGRELNATEDRRHFLAGRDGLAVVEGKDIAPFRAAVHSARWRVPEAVASRLLGARHRLARLAYRDVAGATNRQTLIAAVLPAGCVSIHTVFCLRTALPSDDQHLLCGLFNSYVVNFLARLRVTTHVTTAIVERLPVPERTTAPGVCGEIAALARLLRMRPDAEALARLNALVARLYRLSDAELAHVLRTFPLVPEQERDAVQRAFRELGSMR